MWKENKPFGWYQRKVTFGLRYKGWRPAVSWLWMALLWFVTLRWLQGSPDGFMSGMSYVNEKASIPGVAATTHAAKSFGWYRRQSPLADTEGIVTFGLRDKGWRRARWCVITANKPQENPMDRVSGSVDTRHSHRGRQWQKLQSHLWTTKVGDLRSIDRRGRCCVSTYFACSRVLPSDDKSGLS